MISFSKLQTSIFLSVLFLTTPVNAANQKPIAHAGENQNVAFAQTVTLSAEKSMDNDGVIKSYRWQQAKGIRVKLDNAMIANPTFIAPKKATTLIFKVIVTDNQKASAFATVQITVHETLLKSKLNDTGITFCSDGAFNTQSCNIPSYPHQDGEFGRDFENNDDEDGHAGFSFRKIGENGETLPFDARNWACVKDNVSGLIWENKTFQNTQTLFTFNEAQKLVDEQNQEKLCGLSNWRLPQIQELQNLVDYSFPFPEPAIDLTFFPNTINQIYWSATSYAKNDADAWGIYFDDGRVFEQTKNSQAGIRLVASLEKETISQKYVISNDGQEVLDTQTQLIWRRCVEGMLWNGKSCEGHAWGGMLVESLERAVSESKRTGKNWRLPNIKELASLVDFSQEKIAIDENIFPQTPNDQFWSSSPYAMDAFYGWVTHFYYGSSYYTYLEDTGMIRLVRKTR